ASSTGNTIRDILSSAGLIRNGIRDSNRSRPLDSINQNTKSKRTTASNTEKESSNGAVLSKGMTNANPPKLWNMEEHRRTLEERNQMKTSLKRDEKHTEGSATRSELTRERTSKPNSPMNTITDSISGKKDGPQAAKNSSDSAVEGHSQRQKRKQAEPQKINEDVSPAKKPAISTLGDILEMNILEQPERAGTSSSSVADVLHMNESQVEKLLHDVKTAVLNNIESVQTSRPLSLQDLLHIVPEPVQLIDFDAPACEVDKNYWTGKTASPQCPRGCPLDKKRKDSKAARHDHYRSIHYDKYFELVTSKRSHIEDYLCKALGDSKGPRACLHCTESARFSAEFKDRNALARHIKNHRSQFRKLSAGYIAIAIDGRRAENSELHVIL
ncbi:hypothetical protein PMAYCL1PPCAC_10063, partial [Pristionchus mayeri]